MGSIAVVFVLLVTTYLYIKGEPRYSLYQFRSAIEDHDAEKALNYLDIDAIVDNLMRDLMSEENSFQPENEWEVAGRNIGKAMGWL